MSVGFIELDQATLRYPRSETPAVVDISLSVPSGGSVALVGPSGCGKSSVLRLIAGLETATGGRVTVGGGAPGAARGAVGVAFQKSTMLDWRTVLDNVLLPLEVVSGPTGFRARRAEYRERALALLARLGLGEYAHRYPWEMSGGMQQRASLCRALIHEPDLLLLDEPFAALDAFTREDLWGLVQSIWQERRPTTVLVTHDLREAVYLADTVYVFSKGPGRIVHREAIDLPRPRTVEGTFEPAFVEYVQRLRGHIVEVRETDADKEPAHG
ncbi:ABC transporter ATP-binding protein [Alcanivorax marinus]|uniref:ABC transporter ATP-binding protein n=1 Tax=Alloalcanivorax marinus TaxID=1177169 RepID=A0A9Q3UJK4_9GAMM|nr:ABC transporter ATP-binding protein [Alloalcanivorax marinus]MCC4308406.1 ABC transporter ATP-binding protein [Alloalcanivorax marinus]